MRRSAEWRFCRIATIWRPVRARCMRRSISPFSGRSRCRILPENFGWFHSSLARDAHGGLVPDNNNITSVADAVLDKALEAERDAATEEALERATHAVQRRIYELAVWVPGWRDDCARLAYWRWLSFPDTPETRFSVPDVYNPLEAHLYWIDEERLEETQRARREGKSFGEVDRVYADYRAGGSGGV